MNANSDKGTHVEAKLYAYHKVRRSGEDHRGLVAQAKFSDLSGHLTMWVEEETAIGHRCRWVPVDSYQDWCCQQLNDYEYGYLQLKSEGLPTQYITIHNGKP
jgi:hypothetical protein